MPAPIGQDSCRRAVRIVDAGQVGMATDACITATARETKDLGYVAVVVGEACATFPRPTPEGAAYPAATVQGVSLAALAASGIKVCTASEAIELVAC